MNSVIQTTVYSVKRLHNSVNGSPRFQVNTLHGTWKTAGDHSFVLSTDMETVPGKSVKLTLTRSGYIENLEVLGFDPDFKLP